MLTPEQLRDFEQKVTSVQCKGCGNHCQLTINVFADGKRFISGNRCEKPVTGKATDESLDLYAYKLALLLDYKPVKGRRNKKIGIPLCLNMYELLPFWHSFFTTLGFEVVTSPGVHPALCIRKARRPSPAIPPASRPSCPTGILRNSPRWASMPSSIPA